jgi:hypothetical protein
VYLYILSPIRLHGIVLNSLSTGTTLPFYLPHVEFNESKHIVEIIIIKVTTQHTNWVRALQDAPSRMPLKIK